MSLIKFFFSRLEVLLRKFEESRSRRLLAANHELWSELQEYLKNTKSTGCGYIDYATLYSLIKSLKPVEVLECGTGVSTLIIAHALKENELATGIKGRVTSLEEFEDWLEMSRTLLPKAYHSLVDFVLTDTVEDSYSMFRGVRYRDTPKRSYDFVFVDGPKYRSPLDGSMTFDFDFIHVLKSSEHPVAGLIDKRVSTCFVLQQILGVQKVKYSPVKGLGFIRAASKADLGRLPNELSSLNFQPSFRLAGKTVLRLHPLK